MNDENPRGLTTWLAGFAQSMTASIVWTAIGAICVAAGWYKQEEIGNLSNWPIWAAVVGALFFLSGSARWVYLAYRRWIATESISRPYADRIGILLARLVGDDANNSAREIIYDGLRRELGHAATITPWPEALSLGEGTDFDVEETANKTAQKWLARKGNDVLIWGRLKPGNILSLRFTLAEGSSSQAQSHVLTEKLELPLSAVEKLGTVIAARAAALAAPAINNAGTYIVPKMRAVSDRLRALAENPPPSFSADARGATLFSYALACEMLGEQTGNSQHLVNAIAAYREALKECTRDRVPLDWAMTQNNLGNALQTLGARETGTSRLNEAATAYHEALKEYTRNHVPLNWAMTRNNLGSALATLGKRETGTTRLNEAVTAFREALQERTRDRVPLDWAATQNNLGSALATLGERETGTTRLNESVAAFREALKEYTRDRVPLRWAIAQNNLGNALAILGARETGTARLDEAVTAYREALKERTRDRVPLNWATSWGNQGVAMSLLAERKADCDLARLAATQIEEARNVAREGGHAPLASIYEHHLPLAQARVAKLCGQD